MITTLWQALSTCDRMWVDSTMVRLRAQGADEGEHVADLPRVEAVGGLVEDQHLGLVDERLGESDALAVALGEVPEQATR